MPEENPNQKITLRFQCGCGAVTSRDATPEEQERMNILFQIFGGNSAKQGAIKTDK